MIALMQKVRRVCVVPCDTVIDGRAGHAFSLVSDAFPQPPDFVLAGMTGDVALHVEPGSNDKGTWGRVMIVPGALGFLAGAVWVPLGFTNTVQEEPGSKAASVSVLVGGAAVLAAGIALMATSGTHIRLEPRAPAAASSLWTGAF